MNHSIVTRYARFAPPDGGSAYGIWDGDIVHEPAGDAFDGATLRGASHREGVIVNAAGRPAPPGYPGVFRAKGADSFGPLGPAIVTNVDYGGLGLQTGVNGEVGQSANTSDVIEIEDVGVLRDAVAA